MIGFLPIAIISLSITLLLSMEAAGCYSHSWYRDIKAQEGAILTLPPSPNRIGSCFSESDTVIVLDKRWKTSHVTSMKDLQVGDMVQTSTAGVYEPVYSFGHHHPSKPGRFVQLYTDGPHPPLEISPRHLIFVQSDSGKEEAVRADTVQVGDHLVGNGNDGGVITVTKIGSVTRPGLYMPLTASGTIVVNGIKTSTYVSVELEAPAIVEAASRYFGFSHQTLLHWWLAPYRMLCLGVSSKFGQLAFTKTSGHDRDEDEEAGVLYYLLYGRRAAVLLQDQPAWLYRLLAIPAFLLFGFFICLETLFGPSLTPIVMLAMGISVIGIFRSVDKIGSS